MKNKDIQNWVNKYFKTSKPHKALVMFNNEYNDEGYDVSLGMILVFDVEGNELIPDNGKSVEARKYMPACWNLINDVHDDEEDYSKELDDIVIELEN